MATIELHFPRKPRPVSIHEEFIFSSELELYQRTAILVDGTILSIVARPGDRYEVELGNTRMIGPGQLKIEVIAEDLKKFSTVLEILRESSRTRSLTAA